MSMHKVPLTKDEEEGLSNHGLAIGKPSQLADCFRLGMAWQATRQQAAVVPSGWARVPKVAVREMKDAAIEDLERQGFDCQGFVVQPVYHAMLAAAPQAACPTCNNGGAFWGADGIEQCLKCHPAAPQAEQPVPQGTTSDQYRAELYDEVWQRARDMGYSNVTEALVALDRHKAQAEQVVEPWYGHKFKEIKRGQWQCSCGKSISEQFPPTPDVFAICMLVAEAAYKGGCGRDRAVRSDVLRDLVESATLGTVQPTPDVSGLSQAATDLLAERQRQISVEGWTPDHDDSHSGCELAAAAATYALCTEPQQLKVSGVMPWPWAKSWWKPKTYRENLVKAGALILAEIERIDRAAHKQEGK